MVRRTLRRNSMKHQKNCNGAQYGLNLYKICCQDSFSMIQSMRENKEVHYNKLCARVTFQVSSTKNSFFLVHK
jgi:hypothetical protein